MMFNSKEHNNVLRRTLETREVLEKIPIWFMRQAGRYLPEYQEAMSEVTDFLQACYNPTLVEKITLQPIERFDLDAAIIFSDIMTIPNAMGFHVDFPRGKPPKVFYENRRKLSQEATLDILSPVLESIKKVRGKLEKGKDLIGFIGAPWTLATYILGKENKTKELLLLHRSGDATLKNLLAELTDLSTVFLSEQARAGVDVVQIFDSNAGELPHDLFYDFVVIPTQKIIQDLKNSHPHLPVIGFPRGAGTLYNLYATKTGVDATSVDYFAEPAWIRCNISGVVQGNLDPTILVYDAELAVRHTKNILDNLARKPLIFNLGHGILPNTPTKNIELVVETVRNYTYS